MNLPPQMDAMGQYRQFIVWRLEPRPNEKKDAKVPFNPATGFRVDPMDPANWLTKAEAEQLSAQYGCYIGFVLTAQDNLFCVDLDECYQNGEWSAFACQVFAMFPDALFELSFNGNGGHIWGISSWQGEHRKRNKDVPGLEVYTRQRFIALTGNVFSGSFTYDYAQPLCNLINTYLPGLPENEGSGEWSTGPVPEWSGYTDDVQLLQAMFTSGGAKAQFGFSCSVQSLWNADPDQLAAHYPPDSNDTYGFNHSSADAALCQHLAFWTGKDCERMERLFGMSELGKRDKWVEREDYRQRTVLQASANCNSVYGQDNAPKEAVAPQQQATTPVTVVEATDGGPSMRQGVQYMTANDQINYFANFIYVKSANKIYGPDGEAYDQQQFNAMFGGYEFQMRADNTKPSKSPWEAFLGSQMITWPKVHHWCFRPEIQSWAIIEEEGLKLLNAYIPTNIKMVEGDPTRFIEHVKKLLPDERDREIIMSYAAACVQFQGTKFQWAPLLQGVEGNGKTLIASCIAHAVGERNTHIPAADKLGGQFNAWIERKLFIIVEELLVGQKIEVMNSLKPLITNPRIEIEGKHANQITGDNRANFWCCTNYKNAIIKTKRDRRYSIFYTPQQEVEDLAAWGMDGDYFPDLYDWLKKEGGYEIVAHYLMTYPIPDAFNPATKCHRAPDTTSTEEAIKESRGAIESVIIEAIEEGAPGFQGGWISSTALSRLLDTKRMGNRLTPRGYPSMLRSLGFIPHPALPGGRAPTAIDGGRRPVIYIGLQSPEIGITEPSIVTDRYLTAQNMAPAQVFDGVQAVPPS